jgi:hypothetical protein
MPEGGVEADPESPPWHANEDVANIVAPLRVFDARFVGHADTPPLETD